MVLAFLHLPCMWSLAVCGPCLLSPYTWQGRCVVHCRGRPWSTQTQLVNEHIKNLRRWSNTFPSSSSSTPVPLHYTPCLLLTYSKSAIPHLTSTTKHNKGSDRFRCVLIIVIIIQYHKLHLQSLVWLIMKTVMTQTTVPLMITCLYTMVTLLCKQLTLP